MSRLGIGVSLEVPESREFAILGPFRSRAGGAWVEALSPQASRLGAALAAFPGQTLSVARIINLVWGDNAPATAASAMRVYVSQLRRQWGDESIVVTRDGYQLVAPSDSVDAYRFLSLARGAKDMARRGHLARAHELLTEALALWRGDPAVDTRDTELRAFLAMLHESRANAEYERALCRLELANDDYEIGEVIAEASRLALLFPDRELPQMLLARALCVGGRRSEALEVIKRFVSGSGLSESASLREFELRIARQDGTLSPLVSRGITNIAEVQGPNFDAGPVVAAARHLLVDAGVHALGVISADASGHPGLVTALAQALRGDFPLGQVQLLPGQTSMSDLDEAVLRASRGRYRAVQSLDDPAWTLFILPSDDPAAVRVLVDELALLIRAPRLVVVSRRSVGAPHEVHAGS